jgi:membrane protein involved in D-alanine export
VLLDIYDGRAKNLSAFDYVYFLLFFPSVASGPIDRFGRFSANLSRRISRTEYLETLKRGLWKLFWGAFCGIALSGLCWRLWLSVLPSAGFWANWSYMYGYTLYLFFNFAGYSAMAIGTAYILGVNLPENFNMPFLSLDMKDFWARWHMTLSGWLRDYVYTRFVMSCLRAKRFKNQRAASYIGYGITMLLMGAWHGLTPGYLLYGAYHGALMCLNEALDLHCTAFKGLKRGFWGQGLLALVTFHLFSFGLLIFSGRII